MEQIRIEEKMHALEKLIDYEFKNINHLATALNRTKIFGGFGGVHNKTYINEYYALIGDPIIKIVLSERLYAKGRKTKGEVTIFKQNLECNDIFYFLSLKYNICMYAFNENHFADDKGIMDHERVASSKHDSFIEAITGAIYFDKGFDAAHKWVNDWIVPKLQEIFINII